MLKRELLELVEQQKQEIEKLKVERLEYGRECIQSCEKINFLENIVANYLDRDIPELVVYNFIKECDIPIYYCHTPNNVGFHQLTESILIYFKDQFKNVPEYLISVDLSKRYAITFTDEDGANDFKYDAWHNTIKLYELIDFSDVTFQNKFDAKYPYWCKTASQMSKYKINLILSLQKAIKEKIDLKGIKYSEINA